MSGSAVYEASHNLALRVLPPEQCSNWAAVRRQHRLNLLGLAHECLGSGNPQLAQAVCALVLELLDSGKESSESLRKSEQLGLSSAHHVLTQALWVLAETLKTQDLAPPEKRRRLHQLANTHPTHTGMEAASIDLALHDLQQGDVEGAHRLLSARANASHTYLYEQPILRATYSALLCHMKWALALRDLQLLTHAPSAHQQQGARQPREQGSWPANLCAFDRRQWLALQGDRQLREAWRECEMALKAALVLHPSCTVVSLLLCHTYLVAGRLDAALATAQAAAAASPASPDAHMMCALLHQMADDAADRDHEHGEGEAGPGSHLHLMGHTPQRGVSRGAEQEREGEGVGDEEGGEGEGEQQAVQEGGEEQATLQGEGAVVEELAAAAAARLDVDRRRWQGAVQGLCGPVRFQVLLAVQPCLSTRELSEQDDVQGWHAAAGHLLEVVKSDPVCEEALAGLWRQAGHCGLCRQAAAEAAARYLDMCAVLPLRLEAQAWKTLATCVWEAATEVLQQLVVLHRGTLMSGLATTVKATPAPPGEAGSSSSSWGSSGSDSDVGSRKQVTRQRKVKIAATAAAAAAAAQRVPTPMPSLAPTGAAAGAAAAAAAGEAASAVGKALALQAVQQLRHQGVVAAFTYGPTAPQTVGHTVTLQQLYAHRLVAAAAAGSRSLGGDGRDRLVRQRFRAELAAAMQGLMAGCLAADQVASMEQRLAHG
ncbi:hypothetical protein V8C86DRAFT_3139605 [Haematococcus lacustris]